MAANRSPWRRADVALALIVTAASLVACLTLALTLSGSGIEALLALVVTVCTRTLSETFAHRADIGRLFVFLPLGLGFIFAIGKAAQLLYSTWRWTSALSPLRRSPTRRLVRLTRICGLSQHTIVVQTERPLVFTHGLLRPKVWLSTGLMRALNDDELEAVLRHEDHHRQVRDPLRILLAQCLSRALFFVPVARDLCDAYTIAKEIAADARATREMGDTLPLASALRKMIAGCPAPELNTPLAGDSGMTEARLLALLDPAHPLPHVPMRRLGLSLLWLSFFVAVSLTPTAGHAPSYSECTVPATYGLLRLLF